MPSQSPAAALTHFDAQGQAHMVDVGGKANTRRTAVATGRIEMMAQTLAIIEAGTVKKGDVLGIARIAGIQATKKTSDLIPLCHPLALTRVAIEFEAVHADSTRENAIICHATVETTGPTGVEMEAMTAASVAGLALYDMVKGVERGVRIDVPARQGVLGTREDSRGHWSGEVERRRLIIVQAGRRRGRPGGGIAPLVKQRNPAQPGHLGNRVAQTNAHGDGR